MSTISFLRHDVAVLLGQRQEFALPIKYTWK